MTKLMRAVSMVILLAFLLGTFLLTGCTKYANEEQLRTLDQTKEAALSAEQKVEDLQKQKENLEKEKSSKQTELNKVKDEKETVKERLSNWE